MIDLYFGSGNGSSCFSYHQMIRTKYYFSLDHLLLYLHIKEHTLLRMQGNNGLKIPYTIDLCILNITEQWIIRKLGWTMKTPAY